MSSESPRIKADLMTNVVHGLVLDIVQMRRLGVEWRELINGLKGLALERVFRALDHEENYNDQTINAAWLNTYGSLLRGIVSSKNSIQGVIIESYVDNKTLSPKEQLSASKAVIEALEPIWTLFEATREAAPSVAILAIGSANLLKPAPKGSSESHLLALDYIRWQLTDEVPPRLMNHPKFS